MYVTFDSDLHTKMAVSLTACHICVSCTLGHPKKLNNYSIALGKNHPPNIMMCILFVIFGLIKFSKNLHSDYFTF